MKLALGTVQFGLPYGVANMTGQVDTATAMAIVGRAQSAGMDTIDTAIAYGESENCLGEVGVHDWRIITKLPEIPDICPDVVAWVKDQVQCSLSRLKVTCLSGLLLHRPNQLLGPKGKQLWAALQCLKKGGIVEKIGFSIYDPDELNTLWPVYQPDLVQAPYNVLDRRLTASGWLQRLNEAGVEVHVRSVFLQGLLLMRENERPKMFDRWSTVWTAWEAWLCEPRVTALHACLGFAMANPQISRVIVGVDNLSQLEEILSSANAKTTEYPQELGINDLDLINPAYWDSL